MTAFLLSLRYGEVVRCKAIVQLYKMIMEPAYRWISGHFSSFPKNRPHCQGMRVNLCICRNLPVRTHQAAVRSIMLKDKSAVGLVEPKYVVFPIEITGWSIRKLPVGAWDKLPLVLFDR